MAGKPDEGVVRLRAFHQSGSVVIEVIDDGAGISTERVLAKAIERGLVTPSRPASMTQREALQMLFVPGFSTAPEVTTISGRGVGLDVVRANVEQVGGSVELESRIGLGTTLRLRVPLTLAIVPALVVRSGGQSFALPQNALVELVYVTRRDADSRSSGSGVRALPAARRPAAVGLAGPPARSETEYEFRIPGLLHRSAGVGGPPLRAGGGRPEAARGDRRQIAIRRVARDRLVLWRHRAG